jgi:polysaccharide deacetylase 2 family uncharacterized protein YibQ
MAKKKKSRSKKKPSKKRAAQKANLKRAVYGIFIVLSLVIVTGVVAHYLIPKKESSKTFSRKVKKPVRKPPVYEIYPKEKPQAPPVIAKPKPPMPRAATKPKPKPKPKPFTRHAAADPKPAAQQKIPKPPPSAPHRLPIVAIIIDDMGYDRKLAKRFLDLDTVFTFSILHLSPFRNRIAKAAHEKGVETMLHLPMEPDEYPTVDPGPGALLSAMTPDELIRQLEKNLDDVPFIKGVNNHMGSKMTKDAARLRQIFTVLKRRDVFFIDSRTTSKTVCRSSAHLFQVPFAERSVFLDHIQRRDFIRKQIDLLVRIAERDGIAVGIAHPHTATYDVLREMIPELKKRVRLAPASQIVGGIG